MHGFKIEVTKFTLVGAANFVLTFVVFTVLLKVMLVNYLLSLLGAWLVGLVFSYVLNFSWVFKPEEKVQQGAIPEISVGECCFNSWKHADSKADC